MLEKIMDISEVRLLVVSRGKGNGHALRDYALVEALRTYPNIEVQIASYGTGMRALAAKGEPAYDLEMIDDPSFLESIIKAHRMIQAIKPDLIIAHEEWTSLLAGRSFEVPSLFITDWFFDPGHFVTQSMAYADEVIFIDNPGLYTVPPELHNKLVFAGPLLRTLGVTRSERRAIRHEFGIGEDTKLVSFINGTTYESTTPVAQLVLQAYDLLPYPDKRLIWVDGVNKSQILALCKNREDIFYSGTDWNVERIMVASDVVINKGTRNILRELNALGVPSLSLSYGRNWPDDVLANNLKNNISVMVQDVNANKLSQKLMQAISLFTGIEMPEAAIFHRGQDKVIERILLHAEATRVKRPSFHV